MRHAIFSSKTVDLLLTGYHRTPDRLRRSGGPAGAGNAPGEVHHLHADQQDRGPGYPQGRDADRRRTDA